MSRQSDQISSPLPASPRPPQAAAATTAKQRSLAIKHSFPAAPAPTAMALNNDTMAGPLHQPRPHQQHQGFNQKLHGNSKLLHPIDDNQTNGSKSTSSAIAALHDNTNHSSDRSKPPPCCQRHCSETAQLTTCMGLTGKPHPAGRLLLQQLACNKREPGSGVRGLRRLQPQSCRPRRQRPLHRHAPVGHGRGSRRAGRGDKGRRTKGRTFDQGDRFPLGS